MDDIAVSCPALAFLESWCYIGRTAIFLAHLSSDLDFSQCETENRAAGELLTASADTHKATAHVLPMSLHATDSSVNAT